MFKIALVILTIGQSVTVQHVPFNRMPDCRAELERIQVELILAGGWLQTGFEKAPVFDGEDGRLVLRCTRLGKLRVPAP